MVRLRERRVGPSGDGFSGSSLTVTLRVTDDESADHDNTVTIQISNVDPTVLIVAGPLSSPEGTEIGLISSVTDPGAADTHTYDWAVTKDGDFFASGTDSTFNFTPQISGSYKVTLVVTDDDDEGIGTDSRTIEVVNVQFTLTMDGAPDTTRPFSTIQSATICHGRWLR